VRTGKYANPRAGEAPRIDPRLIVAATSAVGLAYRIVVRRKVSLIQLGEALAATGALVAYLRERRSGQL
jgi:hypothetical protein